MDKENLPIIWVMRAGKMSEAQKLFLQSGIIALNEPGLGNLKKIAADRQAFCKAYRPCDPSNTNTGISGIGGKYFRFVHEVKIGDMVLFPSYDGQVYLGFVISNYFHAPKSDKKFPHQRKVQWKLSFDKSALSLLAKRELGAARTFFQFRRNVREVLELTDTGPIKKLL